MDAPGSNSVFTLDDAAAERFSSMLQEEGVMRAGFVIHESANFHDTDERD